MLVVLAIVAALATVVGPAALRTLQAAQHRGAESDLRALLASLPLAAFARGQALAVDAALLNRRLDPLPDDCTIVVAAPLVYSPNGMTAGGTVHLACAGRVTVYVIEPVTGEVQRVQAGGSR